MTSKRFSSNSLQCPPPNAAAPQGQHNGRQQTCRVEILCFGSCSRDQLATLCCCHTPCIANTPKDNNLRCLHAQACLTYACHTLNTAAQLWAMLQQACVCTCSGSCTLNTNCFRDAFGSAVGHSTVQHTTATACKVEDRYLSFTSSTARATTTQSLPGSTCTVSTNGSAEPYTHTAVHMNLSRLWHRPPDLIY